MRKIIKKDLYVFKGWAEESLYFAGKKNVCRFNYKGIPKEVPVLKLFRKGSAPIEHEPYFGSYYTRKQLHQWGS